MAGIFDFLFGSGDKYKQLPTMSNEQQRFLSSILSQLGGMGSPSGSYGMAQNSLQDLLGGGDEAYQRFADPYMRQFQEQTIPGIAERFASRGALSSSAFGQSLGSAGADLQSQLASLRGGLQQNAIQSALGQYNSLAGLGLGAQPFGYYQQRGGAGVVPGFLSQMFGPEGGGYGALSNLFGFSQPGRGR